MSLHYGHVTERPDGKYEAYCQCGWVGPVRDAKLTAQNDAGRHELRETISPDEVVRRYWNPETMPETMRRLA